MASQPSGVSGSEALLHRRHEERIWLQRDKEFDAQAVELRERIFREGGPPSFQQSIGQLHERLQRMTQELEDTVRYQQEEIAALEAELERERSYAADQREFEAALRAEVAARGAETDPQGAARDRTAALQSEFARLRQSFAAFVTEQFRLAGDEAAQYQPLVLLLQTLMNSAVRGDPWISTAPPGAKPHHPAFVELLVRARIAERDPADARRLRLADLTY